MNVIFYDRKNKKLVKNTELKHIHYFSDSSNSAIHLEYTDSDLTCEITDLQFLDLQDPE